MAVDSAALPTLLCSRPRATDSIEALKRRRPAPVALEISEESAETPQPTLRIKNTFIEGAARRSPSFENFYRERAVHTCPSKHAGRLANLLEEIATGGVAEVPTATPAGIQTPCNIQTPLADGFAQLQSFQQWCLPPALAFNGYMQSCQATGLLPNVFTAAAAPPAAQQGNLVARPILSLSGALQHDVRASDQAQSHGIPAQSQGPVQLPPHYSEFLSAPVAQGIGGVDGCSMQPQSREVPPPQHAAPTLSSISTFAAADGSKWSSIAPVQPPSPPNRPALGTPELPSLGSTAHGSGDCRPCAFLHTKGCNSGLACQFCHLCGPDERKMRRKDKVQAQREAIRARKERQVLQAGAGDLA